MNPEQKFLQLLQTLENEICNTMNNIGSTLPQLANELNVLFHIITQSAVNHSVLMDASRTAHLAKLLGLDSELSYVPHPNLVEYCRFFVVNKLNVSNVSLQRGSFQLEEGGNVSVVYQTRSATEIAPDFEYRLCFQFSNWSGRYDIRSHYWAIRAPLTPDWYHTPLTCTEGESALTYDRYLSRIIDMPERYLNRAIPAAVKDLTDEVFKLRNSIPLSFIIRDSIGRLRDDEFSEDDPETIYYNSFRSHMDLTNLISGKPTNMRRSIDYALDSRKQTIVKFTLEDVGGYLIAVKYREKAESTEYEWLYFYINPEGVTTLLIDSRIENKNAPWPKLSVFQLDDVLERLKKSI